MCSPKRSSSQFLGCVGCGTIMLNPLAVQGFRIIIQLAHKGPPKFRQHRPIALGVDGMSAAAAIFEEVEPVTPLLLMHQIVLLAN